jgi:hypothetical protein
LFISIRICQQASLPYIFGMAWTGETCGRLQAPPQHPLHRQACRSVEDGGVEPLARPVSAVL